MLKMINRIALVVLLVLAGVYFLQSKINSPEECQKIAGVWNDIKETCEQTTEQTIYENLSAGYPLTMTYPERYIQVKIDKSETVEGVYYLRGHYEKILQEAIADKEAIYDRGSLYLNMTNMKILNESEAGLVHYAAPFIANTAGSGVFVYIGLFSYDMHTKHSEHLDSALLGNRIREENIALIKDYLQVDFKAHAKDQAFADYPTQETAIYLQLDNNFSAFTTVKRMHSSWDENQDGMNDCESDGSCDHTIDYSVPRTK